jgi:CubicO group peptidase (beta-lactamase class C family)
MSLLRCFVVALLVSTSVSAQFPKGTPAFISDSLDNYIQQGMKDWTIPGLSVAIVKDGQVVFMRGYGVRDVKTNSPVDENTLFMIASNSKLFTGTALANLEFNNKLSLNDKVTKYIRDFALYDKNTTELVNIRDLLSHRIGTKTFQGDFTFWSSNLSRKQIMYRMRFLKPSGNFRQDYGYCNSCFLTAGELIPIVTGQPWEVYVYDSILMPLGMNNTHMLTAGMDQRRNASKPYTTQYSGTITEVPYDKIDNLGPATSIVSNVKDLSQWLLMQLDSGRLNNKRVLPWQVLRKTREVQIVTASTRSNTYPTHFTGYGLGVNASDYNGRQIYHHTGGAFGFVSSVCFVPEEKLGIIVLTNQDNQSFFEALRYQVLDAYLGVPFTNRSENALRRFTTGNQMEIDAVKALQARVKSSSPPKDVSAYVGDYFNEVYGHMVITKDAKAGRLNIELKSHNSLTATLDYMDNGEWMLSYNHQGYGFFPTRFKVEKGKTTLEMRVNDFLEQDPYVFIKNLKPETK